MHNKNLPHAKSMEINLYENQSLKLIYTKYLQPDQYTFNRINIPSTGSIYLQPDQYTFNRINIPSTGSIYLHPDQD